MPVLAEIQLILDLLNSIEPPPPPKDEAELLDRVRAQIGMVQEPVNESLAVASVENVILEWDGLKISARAYKPLNQPVALMVYLHGGGFCAGNLDTHDGLMRRYCGNGSIVVVNVDYRLAPENPFPAGVDDALAATLWAQQNAANYGLRSDQVLIGGDSAGGNLAAVTAQSHSRMAVEGKALAPLAGHIMIFPGVDMRYGAIDTYPSRTDNAVGYLLTLEMMQIFSHFYSQSGAIPEDVRVSPLLADNLAGQPPALLVTAEFDPLRDEGEAYAHALKTAGVDVTLKRFDGTIHWFTMFSSLACAQESDALVFEFVNRVAS